MSFRDPALAALAAKADDHALSICSQLFGKSGFVAGNYFCVGDIAGNSGESLRVNLRNGRFRDYADPRHHGGILRLVYLHPVGGQDWARTFHAVREMLKEPVPEHLLLRRPGRDKAADTVGIARRLWRQAWPLRHSLAEQYLLRRGIRQGLANLAFDPDCYWSWFEKRRPGQSAGHRHVGRAPALIARLLDREGQFTGIHRIYLDSGGGKAALPDPKKTLGLAQGSACRLQGHDDRVLFATEAIEDGGAICTALPALPVWAASSATHLADMGVPPTTRVVLFGADNDAAGEDAHKWFVNHHADRPDLLIVRARPVRKDWNEDLLGEGADHMANRIRTLYRDTLGDDAFGEAAALFAGGR